MATKKSSKKTSRKKPAPKRGKGPRLRVVPAAPTERANAPTWSKTERAYFAELHRIVDEVFETAASTYDWTWSQLAVHAECAYQTVANLGDRQTKWPRFSTIYKLSKAVGIDLVLSKPKKQRKTPALKAG